MGTEVKGGERELLLAMPIQEDIQRRKYTPRKPKSEEARIGFSFSFLLSLGKESGIIGAEERDGARRQSFG